MLRFGLSVIGAGSRLSDSVHDKSKGNVISCEDYISGVGKINEGEGGTIPTLTGRV